MSINHLPEAEQERIITSLPFVGGLRIEFSREWPAAGVDQGRPGHFTQVLVLRELTERIGAAWVATHLPVDHADPFAALMAAAADRRSETSTPPPGANASGRRKRHASSTTSALPP